MNGVFIYDVPLLICLSELYQVSQRLGKVVFWWWGGGGMCLGRFGGHLWGIRGGISGCCYLVLGKSLEVNKTRGIYLKKLTP